MLEARSISRRYDELLAVDAVSFTIQPGEIVGLLGHNGAGKTTIMKLLSGTLEPDTGDVLLDGKPIHDDPGQLQRRLGYLPEHLPLYPELTVAACLDYAAGIKGLRGDARRRALRESIEATELAERLLSPIGTLSRGLKQRVGVAQALLGSPSLLILDEPTNGLDPQQTERMRELIRQVATRATVILSTHVMQEVEAVCDRVLIVRSGRLAIDARLDDLTRSDSLRLKTRTPVTQLRRVLGELDDIAGASRMPGGGDVSRWHLQIREAAIADGMDAVIGRLVPRLIEAGVEINGITPDSRDLQSLFLESHSDDQTAAGELTHVA